MRVPLLLALAVLCATPAAAKLSAAQRQAEDRQLMKVALPARIEQRCDARALGVINREHPDMKVDRVIAYGLSETRQSGPEINAPGALARSRDHWYRLQYRCRTSPDGLRVESFAYQLGPEEPGWDMDRLGR